MRCAVDGARGALGYLIVSPSPPPPSATRPRARPAEEVARSLPPVTRVTLATATGCGVGDGHRPRGARSSPRCLQYEIGGGMRLVPGEVDDGVLRPVEIGDIPACAAVTVMQALYGDMPHPKLRMTRARRSASSPRPYVVDLDGEPAPPAVEVRYCRAPSKLARSRLTMKVSPGLLQLARRRVPCRRSLRRSSASRSGQAASTRCGWPSIISRPSALPLGPLLARLPRQDEPGTKARSLAALYIPFAGEGWPARHLSGGPVIGTPPRFAHRSSMLSGFPQKAGSFFPRGRRIVLRPGPRSGSPSRAAFLFDNAR